MISVDFDSTRVVVDMDALASNMDAIREKAGVPVMAVVKADAYGHGAVQVARLLQDKCAFFCVSSILEAMELRQAGLTKPILLLGYTPADDATQNDDGIEAIVLAQLLCAIDQLKTARNGLHVDIFRQRAVLFQCRHTTVEQSARDVFIPFSDDNAKTHITCVGYGRGIVIR